jgi:hypothetical protein
VYNLPINHRDFIYNQIREHYEKQAKNTEKQQQSVKARTPNVPKVPTNPTYTMKAPKK